jgi:phospholipase C
MTLSNIDHIVFLMLENRSFDHMLGYLSLDDTQGPKPPVNGLSSVKGWSGRFANLGDGRPYEVNRLAPGRKAKIDDPPHGQAAVKAQIETAPAGPGDGMMGGFVQAYIDSRTQKKDKNGKPAPKPKPKRPGDVMGYYDAEAVGAFDFLARNYCVCDRWYAALPLGTQANRLMSMGGESSIVDNKGLGDFPNQALVYDWLDTNVPKLGDGKPGWRVYTWGGFVPFFTLMKRYRGRIAESILTGEGEFRRYSRFAKHWADMTKPFPSVVFFEPEYGDGPGFRPNDDHPPTGVAGGQALVANIYNTLISNPARWARTLMIVTYDEHGGFFDHAPPFPIDETAGGQAFRTTGPRVPALLISPQVALRKPYSEPLDHTSFLQLLCDKFTPGVAYSPRVARRQSVLTGRIADALGPPRATPSRALAMVEKKSFHSAAHDWISGRASPRAPGTRNGIALDGAVRKLYEEHPKLAEHPDLGEMTAYVTSVPRPTLESDDHIE